MIILTTGILPRWGAQVPYWAPQTGGTAWGRGPHALKRTLLVLKARETCIWKPRGLQKTETLLLRRHTQNLTRSKMQSRGCHMKGAGSDPLLVLKSCLVRKEATNAHSGDADVDNGHFGDLSLPGRCWKAPFWNPPTNPASPKGLLAPLLWWPIPATRKAGTQPNPLADQ